MSLFFVQLHETGTASDGIFHDIERLSVGRECRIEIFGARGNIPYFTGIEIIAAYNGVVL